MAATDRRHAEVARIYVKLGILFTEKVHNAAQATAAWQALLALEPENRRAQDALKKLYLQSKDWNALEAFYAAQNKWDELVRVLERQAETEDEARTRRPVEQDRRALSRSPEQGGSRAEGVREGAVLRRPEPARGAGADPALREGAKRSSGSARCCSSSSVTSRDAGRAPPAHAAADRSARHGRRATSAARCASRCRRSPRRRATNGRSRRRAGWPPRAAAGPSWSRPTRRRCRAPRRSPTWRRVLALLGTLARRVRARAGESRARRSRATRRSSSSRPRTPRRSAALERLYVATGRFADLLAIYDKKLELAKSKAEELEIRFKLAEPLRGGDQAAGQGDRALSGDPRRRIPSSCWRCRRSIACTSSSVAGRSWRRRSPRRSISRTDMAAIAELKFRRGAGPGAVSRGRRGRGRVVPRGAGDRFVARRRAHGAAGLPVEQRRRAAARGRQGAGADLRGEQRSRPAGRGPAHQARAREEDRQARRPAAADRQARRAARATPTRRGRRTRARSPRARRRTPAREALENLANILDNWQPLVALYEKALSAKGKEKLPSALERELLLVVAVAYDEKLEQSDRAVEYFRRAQSIQPEDASALVALERLYTRTERWSDLVDTLLKKAQLVTDPAEREEIRIRIAHGLGRDARQRRAGDRRLERRPAGQPGQRAGAARARPPVPVARRVPRAGRQPAAAAEAGRRRPARDGRAAGAPRRAARAAPRAAGRRGRHLREDPPDRAGAPRDDRGAGADPAQPGARAGRRACCSSRSTRSAATGRA